MPNRVPWKSADSEDTACCCALCETGLVFVGTSYDGDLGGYGAFSSGGSPQPEDTPIANTTTCGSFELGIGGTVTLSKDGGNFGVTIAGVAACPGAILLGINGTFTATPDGFGNWTAAIGSAGYDPGSGLLTGNGTIIISCFL